MGLDRIVEHGSNAIGSSADQADLEEVRLRLNGVLAQEHGVAAWLRALPTQARIVVAGIAIALAVVLPRLFISVDQGPSRWTGPAAVPAAVYATVLMALLWNALLPLHRPRSRVVEIVLVVAGVLIPFGLVDFAPGGACGLLRHLGYCFFIGSAVGWGLLLLLRALDRGDHQDRIVVWLGVGVASLATNLGLQFDCPETGAIHRLTCHATIGLALGLQYWALLRLHERFWAPATPTIAQRIATGRPPPQPR